MPGNTLDAKGWDLIAAVTQEALNNQLKRIPGIDVKKEVELELAGIPLKIRLDLHFTGPQVKVREGSRVQVDVYFPLSGTITAPAKTITFMPNEAVIVTTELLQIKADIQRSSSSNKTTYDLIIDLMNKDLIVNLTTANKNAYPNEDRTAKTLSWLAETLKQTIREEIGTGRQFKVASYDLAKDEATSIADWIPRTARFTWVKNKSSDDKSNLLILMKLGDTTEGEKHFDGPILEDGMSYGLLVSNKMFLKHQVMPGLIGALKKEAADPNSVQGRIVLKESTEKTDMYEIRNTGAIGLKKEHSPWVEKVEAKVDYNRQALYLYLNGQADITFANVRVENWVRSWQQFQVTDNKVGLKQIKEEKQESSSLDWWKWLLLIVTGGIWVTLVAGITKQLIDNKNTGLGGTFDKDLAGKITWPGQNHAKVKKISIPGHVLMDLDVQF